jgi:hypothetical protein
VDQRTGFGVLESEIDANQNLTCKEKGSLPELDQRLAVAESQLGLMMSRKAKLFNASALLIVVLGPAAVWYIRVSTGTAEEAARRNLKGLAMAQQASTNVQSATNR